MTTYLLAGGGTAGHVNPLLATADGIAAAEPDATILVLGTKEGLEARLVPQRGYELLTIPRLPFPRRPGRAAVRFPSRFRQAVAQSEIYIEDRKVDVVVGFGGYAAAPAYLAAQRMKRPLALHEANARPGLANRLGARTTRFVGVTFPGTRLPHARVVGMPLRREIEQLDRRVARAEAMAQFGLELEKPTLLVTGGSTGARSINQTVASAVVDILGSGWQVLHITGERSPVDDPGLKGYRILRYCDRMDLAIAAADLAVARSGAATVSEFTAVGLPAVYVPYPVGNGEQRLNARAVVEAGGSALVRDQDFTPHWVSTSLVPLLLDRARVADLAARAATTGMRDGTARMVELIGDAANAKVGSAG